MRTKLVLPLLIASVLIASCTQSPTGRRQLMLFDDKKLSAMGIQTFEGMKAETPISKNKNRNAVRSKVFFINCGLSPNIIIFLV